MVHVTSAEVTQDLAAPSPMHLQRGLSPLWGTPSLRRGRKGAEAVKRGGDLEKSWGKRTVR